MQKKKIELRSSFSRMCSELTRHLNMCVDGFLNYKYHDIEKSQVMMPVIPYTFTIKYNFKGDQGNFTFLN